MTDENKDVVFKCGITDCDCDSRGPLIKLEDGGESVSCSKCGQSAIDKLMWMVRRAVAKPINNVHAQFPYNNA